MQPRFKILLAAGAFLLLPACANTSATYDETPYERRTAGEGEVIQEQRQQRRYSDNTRVNRNTMRDEFRQRIRK